MKTNNTRLARASGAALAATFAMATAQAADNPFGMQQLPAGYQLAQADKKTDGKCGEGKCGATKKPTDKKADGKCAADKGKDGSCGTDKKMDGKCGDGKKKDGSCGAGK